MRIARWNAFVASCKATMPPSGKCPCQFAPATAMVDKFVETTNVSRGSVLSLLNASFEKRFPQRHNSIFYAKIEDHGVRWGDMGQILARLRRSVASRVAQDLPYWVMCPALYRLTCMALEMGCEAGACFSVAGFMSCIRGSGGQFPPIYFSEQKKLEKTAKTRLPAGNKYSCTSPSF